jgi:hypothetical protein
VCAFSSGRARSSVLGVRPSALIRSRVSGPRCQVPGTGVDPTPKAGYRGPSGGTGHRIRCSAFGSRPSAWTKHAGRSHLPRPSSLHGRGPDTEHRRPSRKRAHGVCILHPASCILHLAYPMCGFFEDRWLVPGSRSRAPGTWDPGPDQRRGPDTEHRRPSRKARYRKTRTQGLHPVSEGRIPSTEPEGQEAIRGCGRSHPFLG